MAAGREAGQSPGCGWRGGEQSRGVGGKSQSSRAPRDPGRLSSPLPSGRHSSRLLLPGWLQHSQPAETCLSHQACVLCSPFLTFRAPSCLLVILQTLSASSVQLLLSPFILSLFSLLLHSFLTLCPSPCLSFTLFPAVKLFSFFLHTPPSLGCCLFYSFFFFFPPPPHAFPPLALCAAVWQVS